MIKKSSIVLGAALVAGLLSGGSVLAATSSANTTVNANVQSVISLTTSGTVSLTPVPGAGVDSGVDTVTVNTNSSNGYILNLKATTSNQLVSGANSIAATSGSWAIPATMSTNSWGYRIDGLGNFGAGTSTYAAVTTAGQNLKTTSTTAVNDVTSVLYGAQVTSSQPSGVYSGQVTYTATTNS